MAFGDHVGNTGFRRHHFDVRVFTTVFKNHSPAQTFTVHEAERNGRILPWHLFRIDLAAGQILPQHSSSISDAFRSKHGVLTEYYVISTESIIFF